MAELLGLIHLRLLLESEGLGRDDANPAIAF